jgi:large subunit ribosomal protein LP0
MSKKAEKSKKEKKGVYAKNLVELLGNYNKILLVNIDNVGAFKIQKTRQALKGKAHLLFGKNTLIRKTIRDYVEKCTEAGNKESARIEQLLPFIKGNVGLAFTNEDLSTIKNVIESFKQKAPAKVGQVAPEDVFVDPGPTGMEPTQTQFLQALNIASKIVKGQVEIINRVHLIKQGEKVGNSEAALLDKLNILPFSYASEIKHVYDAGFVYPSSLLSLGEQDVLQLLSKGIQRIATISIQTGLPTLASVPHQIAKAYRNLISISIETDYEFEGSKEVKAFLKDPSAFISAQPQETATTTTATSTAPVEEKKEEKEEESASIGGLFGDDD